MRTAVLQRLGLGLGIAGSIYGLLDVEPSAQVTILGFMIVWFAMGAWLPADAARHQVVLPFDWGYFIAIGWPILWLSYALRRRPRRWVVALGLLALPLALELGVLAGLFVRQLVPIRQ